MNIQHVPPEFVNKVWPEVVKYIEAGVDRQKGEPDYTVEQIATLVAMGKWMLAVVADDSNKIHGALTIDFFNRPNARIAFVTCIGGRAIVDKDSFDRLCALVKNFGATTIEGAVDDAVARLWRRFGFHEKYKIVEVIL
jgi:hypothetical protein